MYELVVLKKNGEFLKIKSSNLNGLKKTAKEYNRLGCSVEINEIKIKTVFRIVNN